MASAATRSRDDYIFLARIAEQLERYNEMIEYVTKFIESEKPLNAEERTIIATAYKNAVGNRRAELRVLNAIEQKEHRKGNDTHVTFIRNYKTIIENELRNLCKEILDFLEKFLIPKSAEMESKIFFLKMKGDYNRYLCEFVQDNEYNTATDKALEAYTEAEGLSAQHLLPTNPIRLGLLLNLSVFYFEIMQEPEKACTIAKSAFEDAIANLDNVNEETYKDCTLIIQLLRDNLTLWTSDIAAEETHNDEN